MFNIGSTEILIIALVIMFLFGSKKLTEWAKGLGEAGKELKKAKDHASCTIDVTDEEGAEAKNKVTSAMDETKKDVKRTFDINEEKKEDEEKEDV